MSIISVQSDLGQSPCLTINDQFYKSEVVSEVAEISSSGSTAQNNDRKQIDDLEKKLARLVRERTKLEKDLKIAARDKEDLRTQITFQSRVLKELFQLTADNDSDPIDQDNGKTYVQKLPLPLQKLYEARNKKISGSNLKETQNKNVKNDPTATKVSPFLISIITGNLEIGPCVRKAVRSVVSLKASNERLIHFIARSDDLIKEVQEEELRLSRPPTRASPKPRSKASSVVPSLNLPSQNRPSNISSNGFASPHSGTRSNGKFYLPSSNDTKQMINCSTQIKQPLPSTRSGLDVINTAPSQHPVLVGHTRFVDERYGIMSRGSMPQQVFNGSDFHLNSGRDSGICRSSLPVEQIHSHKSMPQRQMPSNSSMSSQYFTPTAIGSIPCHEISRGHHHRVIRSMNLPLLHEEVPSCCCPGHSALPSQCTQDFCSHGVIHHSLHCPSVAFNNSVSYPSRGVTLLSPRTRSSNHNSYCRSRPQTSYQDHFQPPIRSQSFVVGKMEPLISSTDSEEENRHDGHQRRNRMNRRSHGTDMRSREYRQNSRRTMLSTVVSGGDNTSDYSSDTSSAVRQKDTASKKNGMKYKRTNRQSRKATGLKNEIENFDNDSSQNTISIENLNTEKKTKPKNGLHWNQIIKMSYWKGSPSQTKTDRPPNITHPASRSFAQVGWFRMFPGTRYVLPANDEMKCPVEETSSPDNQDSASITHRQIQTSTCTSSTVSVPNGNSKTLIGQSATGRKLKSSQHQDERKKTKKGTQKKGRNKNEDDLKSDPETKKERSYAGDKHRMTKSSHQERICRDKCNDLYYCDRGFGMATGDDLRDLEYFRTPRGAFPD